MGGTEQEGNGDENEERTKGEACPSNLKRRQENSAWPNLSHFVLEKNHWVRINLQNQGRDKDPREEVVGCGSGEKQCPPEQELSGDGEEVSGLKVQCKGGCVRCCHTWRQSIFLGMREDPWHLFGSDVVLLIHSVLFLFSSGEVYILSSSKSMTQTHNGKLYKIIDPKR